MATFDEIQKNLISAIANPDTMETGIQSVLDTLKADYTTFESTSETLEKANARIRDLQDTNHKLFLSQVGQPEKQGQDEPDTGIKWDSLISDDNKK